jgi:hypothetical protein
MSSHWSQPPHATFDFGIIWSFETNHDGFEIEPYETERDWSPRPYRAFPIRSTCDTIFRCIMFNHSIGRKINDVAFGE